MARRDNQGIQIAMIVFILLTLVFMVTTYFGWSSSNRLTAANASLQSDLDTANRGIRDAETRVQAVTTAAGYTTAEEMQTAVEVFGQGMPAENQNFKDIANAMMGRVHGLTSANNELNDKQKSLIDQLREREKQRDEGIAIAEKARKEAKDDSEALAADFATQRAAKESQLSELAKTKSEAVDAMEKAKMAADKTVADVNAELALNKSIMTKKDEQIAKMTVITPDQYDGNVVGVDQGLKSVLLNVGRADGVRAKTIFTIYDADENNVTSAKKKASVEVIRVLDDHTSVAHITDDLYITPIVTGDHIYSPIWDPGRRLGIALLGEMDIDGDGQDDRDYVRNLIQLNGGQIDAEDIEGKVEGALTVNTRYLVKGESPATDAAKNQLLEDAERLSVQQTSVVELLDLMGYQGRARALSYRGIVKPGDFAPKSRNGGITQASEGSYTSFRERAPLRRRNQASNSYK